jgi:hypothetical protein
VLNRLSAGRLRGQPHIGQLHPAEIESLTVAGDERTHRHLES